MVVGNLLITLLRHSDRVTVACLAQLVNVIAPIMTTPDGPAWRQTTFHPFAAVANTARGLSLVTRVNSETLTTRRYGEVPALAAAATHDPDEGTTAVFLTNRASKPTTVELRHRNFPHWATQSARAIAADHVGPRYQIDASGIRLVATSVQDEPMSGTTVVTLPPHSWGVVHASTAPCG